jgi:hypothetical protein
LEVLHQGGANLEFVIARSAPEKPGKGVVFVGPVRGAAEARAAETAGLSKTSSLLALRLDVPNRAGLGAEITRVVADAGINMRGLWAATVGGQSVTYLSFETDADARTAGRLLEKLVTSQ